MHRLYTKGEIYETVETQELEALLRVRLSEQLRIGEEKNKMHAEKMELQESYKKFKKSF